MLISSNITESIIVTTTNETVTPAAILESTASSTQKV